MEISKVLTFQRYILKRLWNKIKEYLRFASSNGVGESEWSFRGGKIYHLLIIVETW